MPIALKFISFELTRTWCFGLAMFCSLSSPVIGASAGLFLNGIDISGARGQELKNVDIIIDNQGQIFIVAPHYQVHEEDTYVPLSSLGKATGPTSHRGPVGLSRGGYPIPGTEAAGRNVILPARQTAPVPREQLSSPRSGAEPSSQPVNSLQPKAGMN